MKIKEKILNIFNFPFSKKEILNISRSEFDQKVYISLEEALVEIEKRRKDPVLVKKVEEYLSEIPEPFLKDNFYAVLSKTVASPQFEVKRFFDLITGYGIKPLIWEYHDDKFHPENKYKYSLGKVSIYLGLSKTGTSIVRKKTLIDFNSNNGKSFRDIKTIDGHNFIDFHHLLLDVVIQDSSSYLFDASEWYFKRGANPKKFYKDYLALFLVHGILFENFSLDKDEISFTNNVFLPAFKHIQNKFGIKPLIVALAPTEIEGAEFWNSYPQHIETHLK